MGKNECPFNKSSEIKDEITEKEEEGNEGHDFIVMPDGTISETKETTPEKYQEIKKDK